MTHGFESISFAFSVDSPDEESPQGESSSVDDSGYRDCDLQDVPSKWELLARWFAHLDRQVISCQERLRSSQQFRCRNCRTENHGSILDESKILLPFPKGNFNGRTDLVNNVYVYTNDDPLGESPSIRLVATRMGPRALKTFPGPSYHRYASYTPYMLVQDVVRSGLFTEAQLRGANGEYSRLLNRHEIEVNAQAYKLVRPVACITCRNVPLSGLSPHHGAVYGKYGSIPSKVASLPQLDSVDDLHAAGKRIRTGFRIRSRAARVMRHTKRRVKEPPKTCYASTCIVDASLAIPVHLLFNVKRYLATYRQEHAERKNRRKTASLQSKREQVKGRVIRSWPMGHHLKYCYFLRKRGFWYTSIHHPYKDDFRYLGSKYSHG